MCEKDATLNIEIGYGAAPEPLKIKLIKNTKAYGWEISFSGDMTDILMKIRAADADLKAEWGG